MACESCRTSRQKRQRRTTTEAEERATYVAEGNEARQQLVVSVYSYQDPAKVKGGSARVALRVWASSTMREGSIVEQHGSRAGTAARIGFRQALIRTINAYANEYKLLKEAKSGLSGEDFREGLMSSA